MLCAYSHEFISYQLEELVRVLVVLRDVAEHGMVEKWLEVMISKIECEP